MINDELVVYIYTYIYLFKGFSRGGAAPRTPDPAETYLIHIYIYKVRSNSKGPVPHFFFVSMALFLTVPPVFVGFRL